MADPTVFTVIGGSLDSACKVFLTDAIARMVLAIKPLAEVGLCIYILGLAFAIVAGTVQMPFVVFVRQSIKISVVTEICLHTDNYGHWVVDTLMGLESGLAAAIAGTASGTSIYSTLDASLGQGLEILGICFQQSQAAGLFSIGASLGWIIAGVVAALGTVIITVLIGIYMVVAKCGLVIVLALGPLFIMAQLWQATAGFYEKWVAQAMNYIMTSVILSGVSTLALTTFRYFVDQQQFIPSLTVTQNVKNLVNPIIGAVEILVVGVVLAFVIQQAGHVAAGLAGGMSMAAMSLQHLASPVRAAKQLANPTSTRRDLQTGHLETASRFQHTMAGNTVLNPSYRKALLENIGRNWGPTPGGKLNEDGK